MHDGLVDCTTANPCNIAQTHQNSYDEISSPFEPLRRKYMFVVALAVFTNVVRVLEAIGTDIAVSVSNSKIARGI